MAYKSKYTGALIDAKLDGINALQEEMLKILNTTQEKLELIVQNELICQVVE